MFARCRPIVLWLWLFAGPAMAQDGVTAWVAELLRHKDDAEPALIEKIAASRTREAALGLVEAFDAMASLLMRREVVRALAGFAGIAEAEQPALQKLADVATLQEDADLRAEAIRALGRSPTLGKALLRKIVDSPAPDSVREPALAEHVKLASADDVAWYRFVWNLEQEQRKDQNGEIAPPELNPIRELAFQGALPWLGEEELVKTLKREINPKIRRRALAWMDQQSMPKAAELAEWVLDRVDFPGADRAEAAQIYVDNVGAKAVAKFLDLMKKRDVTPEDLREKMASLIVAMRDPATDKRLAKMVGRGKPHEKVFLLRATAKNDDPKVLAAIRKQLTDEALEVRRAAGEALARRRDRDSLPALRAMMSSSNPDDLRIALVTITAVEGTSSAWLKELAGYAQHADREVRNAAIEVIGRARDKRQVDVLLTALEHEDWSTRFVAVEAVGAMRQKPGVGKLVERIAVETGRLKQRIADVLWRLTAQPFGEDAAAWQGWWAAAGEKFEVVGERELDKAERERERRRLSMRTTATEEAKFFGIRVESHRVIFVLDISGSMLESMYGRKVDGRGAARIDVARQELQQAIRDLEPGTLFNVLAFASSVAPWRKEGVAVADATTKAAAIEWIQRLGAVGATNLYDSLKMAFADPDVDTIFVLSDGEPTNGEVIDPHRIRLDVAFWNQHRKIKINTIAIGGNLEILEWLARDAGGTYVQMR